MAKKNDPKYRPKPVMAKLQFTLSVGQKLAFQERLAALGLSQNDFLRACVQAFNHRKKTGASIDLEISVRASMKG